MITRWRVSALEAQRRGMKAVMEAKEERRNENQKKEFESRKELSTDLERAMERIQVGGSLIVHT